MSSNKIVYVGTTYKCSACKCMKHIMQSVLEDNPTFKLEVLDYSELPDFIKSNVLLSDFPITVFVEDDVIKDYFVGTKSKRKVEHLMEDIEF